MNRDERLKEYHEALKQIEYDVRGKDEQSIKEQTAIFSQVDEALMPDVYGKGTVIESFEDKMATLFQ